MTENQWTKKEWEAMRQKLETLSERELIILCEKCSIQFEGGFEAVKERSDLSRKEQLILVLDEADREELEREYQKILDKKNPL